ncbi:hypothetical protein EI94DRAFT_1697214 [Lactarius quietus]|nr:hypothetical protein EI94DRAFT_1697214 [Lactarius quietus]
MWITVDFLNLKMIMSRALVNRSHFCAAKLLVFGEKVAAPDANWSAPGGWRRIDASARYIKLSLEARKTQVMGTFRVFGKFDISQVLSRVWSTHHDPVGGQEMPSPSVYSGACLSSMEEGALAGAIQIQSPSSSLEDAASFAIGQGENTHRAAPHTILGIVMVAPMSFF